MAVPFQQLPLSLHFSYPPSQPWHSSQNTIIVSSDYNDTNPGIFKYNITTNKSELLTSYKDAMDAEFHGQFIDQDDILYIFGGDTRCCFTIDLRTKQIKKQDYHALAACGTDPRSVSASTINEIYILAKSDHFKFDCNQGIVETISDDEHDLIPDFDCPKVAFIPFKKQLMVLGGDCQDNIYTLNVDKHSDQSKWTLKEATKMPHCVEEREFDIILFGDVLFVFYVQAEDTNDDIKYSDIWYLDLLNDTWHKSEYSTPDMLGDTGWGKIYALKSRDNDDVHLFNFREKAHFRADLNKLFTKKFIKSRRDFYNPLIMGYLKEQENQNIIMNLPYVLKQIILKYYPIIHG